MYPLLYYCGLFIKIKNISLHPQFLKQVKYKALEFNGS